MMDTIGNWLVQQGLSEGGARIALIVAAIVLSILIGRLLKGLAKIPLDRFIKSHGVWPDAIHRYKVRDRAGWVIATIAAKALVLPLLDVLPAVQKFAAKTVDFLLVIAIAAAVSSLIGAAVYAVEHQDTKRRMPFKVLGQALQISVWVYASVALLAVLSEKDLATVLTSLTAVGAILVYVFRDPILGWTAGVQIAANDLVAKGDWISVPKFAVDGTVEEISLTVVKVRNWDQTVASIPTYSLFSEGFTNWRGMWQSGGRRIQRSISIDAASVRFCDDELLKRLQHSPLIRELDVLSHSRERPEDPISDIRPTNLGVFRAWLEAWLARHPVIRKDMLAMVRELEPGRHGIPVEIYVFSNEQSVRDYENVAGAIVDHVLSVLPEFDLRIFQEPSGMDLRTLDLETSS